MEQQPNYFSLEKKVKRLQEDLGEERGGEGEVCFIHARPRKGPNMGKGNIKINYPIRTQPLNVWKKKS